MKEVLGVIGIAVIVIAALFMLGAKYFKQMEREMSDDLEEKKQTEELINFAMQKYPGLSKIDAITRYITDMENEIIHLKQQSENADTLEPIKQLVADKRRLQQERAHMAYLEVEYNSGFNITTAAQY